MRMADSNETEEERVRRRSQKQTSLNLDRCILLSKRSELLDSTNFTFCYSPNNQAIQSVQSALFYTIDLMTGRLHIKFLSGKVQRNTDIIGKMELFVYACLEANNAKQETQIQWVKGAKNEQVTWNEQVCFTVGQEKIKEARLFLEIRDSDLTKDDVVGSAWLNLYNCGLLEPGLHQTEVTLFYEHVHAGILRIETRYEK